MSQSNPNNNSNPMDVNQMVYLYQVLEDQQSALAEQLNLLESQIQGVNTSLISLNGLKEVQNGHEIIVPLGANAYTYASLKDPEKILVSIGKDILIEKNLEAGIASIEDLKEKYQKIKEKLLKNYQEVSGKIEEIRPIIENVYNTRQ